MVKYYIGRNSSDKKGERKERTLNPVKAVTNTITGIRDKIKDDYEQAVEREKMYFSGQYSEEERKALKEQRNQEFVSSLTNTLLALIVMFLLFWIFNLLT
ncbi:TPA: hypothetical protein ACGOR8_001981 [Streptococcus suis]